MVIRAIACAALLTFGTASGGLANSPQEQMFPGPGSCYARAYSDSHLAKHPKQLVTEIAVQPDFSAADPMLVLHISLRLRGLPPAGPFEAYAYCENEGGHTLYCAMEGDAGGFQITPRKNGAILIAVSSDGMSFENSTGFATLRRNTGDDRSFLLTPTPCP